jgi:hypothetical protein
MAILRGNDDARTKSNRRADAADALIFTDRVVAGLCALVMRPGRLIRSAIVLKPSTPLRLHRSANAAKIPAALLVHGANEAGTKAPARK